MSTMAMQLSGEMPLGTAGREIAAGLQALMVTVAGVWRFSSNEGRTSSRALRIVGPVCFAIACGLFSLTTYNRLGHVELGSRCRDATALYTLSLIQVGYPVVAVMSWVWINVALGKPAEFDMYDPTLSALKDFLYANLDISAKAGLALYLVMRAAWTGPDFEYHQSNCTI